ncbi:MAG: hypothetical protein PHQ20_04850 [Candidatus Moranbacteria bacterium]|nr:hypothetical protein [Candidatus Moranbacteria bacterium]
MAEEIANEIWNKRKEILEKIGQESIDVYLFLKKEFKKGNIKNNKVFQFVFRSYYRLDSAGLSEGIKNEYFDLMAQQVTNLKKILLELYKIKTLRNKNTVQFSFATKLLHTIDENNPIWDTEVVRVMKIKISGLGYKEKIESCYESYEKLKQRFEDLLVDKRSKKVIFQFRNKFKVNKNQISDVKVLDFIIWTLGKLIKK